MVTTDIPCADPATLKVIGVGLPRTGTSSMRDALAMLGFGPCYHMSSIMEEGGKDFPTWYKIGDGNGTSEDFYELFRGYGSVMDAPAALYPAELYAAYPDAKFILTIRDPEKWEKSMKTTILRISPLLRNKRVLIGHEKYIGEWNDIYMEEKYHGGRLKTNAQQEMLDHNERIKKIIPPEKLLVYQVGEGWDRLVDFLGVPKPTEPFPHVNDTAQVEKLFQSWEMKEGTQVNAAK